MIAQTIRTSPTPATGSGPTTVVTQLYKKFEESGLQRIGGSRAIFEHGFDELDHHILVTILQKKIQDQRFLNLIWKLLDAGYMDLHGVKKGSLIGSPQGSL